MHCEFWIFSSIFREKVILLWVLNLQLYISGESYSIVSSESSALYFRRKLCYLSYSVWPIIIFNSFQNISFFVYKMALAFPSTSLNDYEVILFCNILQRNANVLYLFFCGIFPLFGYLIFDWNVLSFILDYMWKGNKLNPLCMHNND